MAGLIRFKPVLMKFVDGDDLQLEAILTLEQLVIDREHPPGTSPDFLLLSPGCNVVLSWWLLAVQLAGSFILNNLPAVNVSFSSVC